MSRETRNIIDGARLGGMIGFAAGTLLQGVTFVLPIGRELTVTRAVAVVVPKAITVSGRAVGTLIGAATGALQGRRSQNR